MRVLQIGLSGWIIQDGNYEDFEVDREYRFALEFYSKTLVPSPPAVPSLSLVGHAHYDGVGSVLYRSSSAWVVDFGIPAYSQREVPAWATLGACCSGRVYVSVDPFFYSDDLVNDPSMPDLFRRWVVRRILLETTPIIESVDRDGRQEFIRDPKRVGYVETRATRAWTDDEGHAEYTLECELQ